jgi:hypothetical protein
LCWPAIGLCADDRRDASHLAYRRGGYHPLASLQLAVARLHLSSGWNRPASGSHSAFDWRLIRRAVRLPSFISDMKLTILERNAEYLLSILLIGLAIFLFREVWLSVQVLEEIHKALLEGAIFTEGPPLYGVKQYLLFCLCSGAWFLFVFAFLLSRRYYPLYLVQFTFSLTPIWFFYYVFTKSSAYYEYGSLWNFLIHQFLPSWNLFWVILSIAVAVVGVRHSRLMRKAAT